jgi:hypothetical protein
MASLNYKLPFKKRYNAEFLIQTPSVLPWSVGVNNAMSHRLSIYCYPAMCKVVTPLSNPMTWRLMTTLRRLPMLTDTHRLRAENLRLYGLLAHWSELEDSTWVSNGYLTGKRMNGLGAVWSVVLVAPILVILSPWLISIGNGLNTATGLPSLN